MNKALTMLLLLFTSIPISADDGKLAKYQYWFDNNHESLVEGAMNGGKTETISFTADASSLVEGMHTFAYRVQDSDGNWSAPAQWAFYNTTVLPGDSIDAIEYWLDDSFNDKKTIAATSGSNTFTVVADTLKEGFHTLSYRTKTNRGRYSTANTWQFYKTVVLPSDSIDAIEYWVDTLYSERKTIAAVSGTNTFQVDASGLREGVHTLAFRTKTNLGRYSSAGVWMFYKTSDEKKATGIKWYKYWWNDREDLAVKEEVDSVASPYTFNKQLTVPDYARGGYNGQSLTARLCIVFGDDAGNVSAMTYADVKYPDINPPVSQIDADKRMAYTSVNLTWSGEDEELKDFNIYVSENDLPYVLWLPNTTATSAEFKGEAGKTYRFTVTARDKSDNVEKFDEEKYIKVIFNKE